MENGKKFDNKTIKKIVANKIKKIDKPDIIDIVGIIRPYYSWDEDDLIERELKNKARAIMRSFKDDEGVRTYFSGNDGFYINIEKSTDLEDLQKVDRQLKQKYNGLAGAVDKVRKRIVNIISRYNGANSTGVQ